MKNLITFIILAITGLSAKTQTAYITNETDNTVSVINILTNTVTATIPVGANPTGVAVSADGNKVYVVNTDDNTVNVINTAFNIVSATIGVGIVPFGIGISPDGSRLYVANNTDNTLSVINTTTNTIIATVPAGYRAYGVSVSPDGSKVYVTNHSDSSVSVLNAATNTVTNTIPVGSGPLGVTFSPDGLRAYVTNKNSGTVSVINTNTDTVLETITVGIQPWGVTVHPDGSKIYVANYSSNTVNVINTTTNTISNTITVSTGPDGISITPDGSKVYVVNHNANSVNVINTTTNSVTDTITVGSIPYSIGNFISTGATGVTGIVYNDINQNCIKEANEPGLLNRTITINPGNIIAQTNGGGIWLVDSLPAGSYTAIADTSGNWIATCPTTQNFIVTNPNEVTLVPNFGFVSTQPCASPEVSINMPFIRPCFSNQLVYVNAFNEYIATGTLNNAFVDVELDSLIIPQSASIAYTSLGNDIYRFQLGNLNPGQSVNFTINCNVSCNATLSQTLCIQANINPVDSCVFDTIPNPYPGNFTPCTLPWDHSSLNVEGFCQNDSIYFVVTNTGQFGNGDMDCYSPIRIYIDGIYYLLDSIQLVGGDTSLFVFSGDGRTWRLEADQHPLHPGNSHPNATVEACGDTANWTPDLVNVLPPDDADPVVDIYCGVVTGSYDPNDKKGYPTGVTSENNIIPNQQLQYVIRFQNTGTDTAFTVVVRDTLDMNLDISSVVTGAASHNYYFQMYGPRVLEWTFNNILLPDSNHNQAGSNGFISFTINQNHNLPNYTKIYNSADIYFDYNVPVITNQTMHTVNDGIQTILIVSPNSKENSNSIIVYPNPASDIINLKIDDSNITELTLNIYNIMGTLVKSEILEQNNRQINIKNLSSGVYIVTVSSNEFSENIKLVIQ